MTDENTIRNPESTGVLGPSRDSVLQPDYNDSLPEDTRPRVSSRNTPVNGIEQNNTIRNNNIQKHTSDKAQTVNISTENVVNSLKDKRNVQEVIDMLGEQSLKTYQLPRAQQTVEGIQRAATQPETEAGLLDNVFVSPLTLSNIIVKPDASETVKGIARYATTDEQMIKSLDNLIINPKTIHYVFDTRKATESESGAINISTEEQAKAGTDDSSAMTPAKVKMAIAKFTPKVEFSVATNSTSGYTKLSNKAQTQEGTLDTGYAVSPKAFIESRASDTKIGTVRFGTLEELRTGLDDSLAVSVQKFNQARASENYPGTVKLTTNPGPDKQGYALDASSPAIVLSTTRINDKPLVQDVVITSEDVNCYNKQESDKRYLGGSAPVGSIMIYTGNTAPHGWKICNGESLHKSAYPGLFGIIGYTYGGTGDLFKIPDLRGEFVRGFDAGRGVDPSRTLGSWQKGTILNGNGADQSQVHGIELAPNMTGTPGRYAYYYEKEERCKNWIYHCRNHPPRWVGGSQKNLTEDYTRLQAAQIFGGDLVSKDDVAGIRLTWTGGSGDNAYNALPDNTKIGNGHVTYSSRPRNIALNYIIKVLDTTVFNTDNQTNEILTRINDSIRAAEQAANAVTEKIKLKRKSYSTTWNGSGEWDRSDTKSFNVTGEVISYPDGKIEQYFVIKNIKLAWLGWNEQSVVRNIPLWTAMPNKITDVTSHIQQADWGIGWHSEAAEWTSAQFDHELSNTSTAHVRWARVWGSNNESVDLYIKIEGF